MRRPATKDRGPDLQEVRRDGVDALGVVDRCADVQHEEVAGHALEDVREGQEAEAAVALLHLHGLERGHDVRR